MRKYPANSPQAAARLVALTMLADGHLSQAELDALQRGGYDRLGIAPQEMHDVLQGLCEDLLFGATLAWSDACRIDEHALSQLVAEVQCPELRERVLSVCVDVAGADAHLSDGESLVLSLAVAQWGLPAGGRLPAPPQREAAATALRCP